VAELVEEASSARSIPRASSCAQYTARRFSRERGGREVRVKASSGWRAMGKIDFDDLIGEQDYSGQEAYPPD
jgi:hypothetical protein